MPQFHTLTPAGERQLRMNVRNFLLVATPEEMAGELKLSQDRGDKLRERFVQELIDERKAEEN